jgi:hypothetical protein
VLGRNLHKSYEFGVGGEKGDIKKVVKNQQTPGNGAFRTTKYLPMDVKKG